MHSTKQRRFPLARIFGSLMLASARSRGRNHLPSHVRLLDELEPRLLLAGTPAQLLFLQQPIQTAAASPMYLAVNVEIADASSQPTTDTSKVVLTIVQGPSGATIDNATAVSVNAVSGIATFENLVFSAPGTYILRAIDGTLNGANSGTFTITPAAAVLYFQHPINTLTAGQLFSPTVEVDEATGLGHPVTTDRSTATLTISSGPTGSTILGTTTATPIGGVFTFSGLSLPTAGTYRLTVQDGSLIRAISNSFTVNPDVPANLVFEAAPASTPVGDTIPSAVVVDVVDAYGNVVTTDSSTVTLSIANGIPTLGTLSGTTSVVAVNGVATFSDLAINTAGAYMLHADDNGLAGTSPSFNITGPADHVVFLFQPAPTDANNPIIPAVQVAVEDALGHVITNNISNVTVSLSPSTGTLSGTTTVQAINGVATFSDLSINAAGDFQLVAGDGALTGATSNTFTVTPPAVALTFSQGPGNVAANSVLYPAITVDVLDATNARILHNSSDITLVVISGPTGGIMNGTTTVAAVEGRATFDNLTFSKQGTYTLLAYDGNLVTETSVDFVVTAPAAKLLFITQPITTSMAGVTLPAFSVRVTDAKGNTVTSDHSDVTLAILGPTGATIGGTTTVTTINGIATFNDLVLTVAGGYTFKVSDSALATATSKSLTITPLLTEIPDPLHPGLLLNPVLLIASSTASTLVGKTIPTLTLREADRYGNLITTVNSGTASLSITAGPSLVLNGTVTAKFVKGVATFKNLSINTAGTFTLFIQAGGITIPASTPYNVSATANHTTVITPVINSLRAPAHSANYALGAPISLSANVGSLVSSSGIPYLNGTGSESVRLVTTAGVTLETGTVSATGAVNFRFSDLPLGSYDIYVVYDGDINHTGARSPVFRLAVGATSTTLAVSSTTVHSGDTLTLTATARNLTTDKLLAGGSIQFFVDGSLTPAATVAISTTSAHTAALSLAVVGTGQHTYQAVFVANATFNTSTSSLKLVTAT